jgi:uncharacterized protein YqgV (UPF0045/DUF77 family)
MKSKIINIGLQLVPLNIHERYEMIDDVIALIKSKQYKTVVTPFETVVECTFEQGTTLMNEINTIMQQQENLTWLLNVRIHANTAEDVFMSSKTDKHNAE